MLKLLKRELNWLAGSQSKEDESSDGLDDVLLSGIQQAFERKQSLVRAGGLAILLNTYNQDSARESESSAQHSFPPHLVDAVDAYPSIAVIADEILQRIRAGCGPSLVKSATARTGFTVVLRGKSGSGKSTVSRQLIEYLVMWSDHLYSPAAATDTFAHSSSVCCSFGNAASGAHSDSSRCGVYYKVGYDKDGLLSSLTQETFFLEKSRLLSPPPTERNFHIFYQLIYGLKSIDPDLSATLKLTSTSIFKMLITNNYHNSSSVSRSEADDVEGFELLLRALLELGLQGNDFIDLWEVLSSILHLGNITWSEGHEEGAPAIPILPDSSITIQDIAQLLGINPYLLKLSLTTIQIGGGRQSVNSKILEVESCANNVHSLIKYIYQRLVSHLIKRCNDFVKISLRENSSGSDYPATHYIGVVDIYGFENIDVNSGNGTGNRLEQLCINYSHERLHQLMLQNCEESIHDEILTDGLIMPSHAPLVSTSLQNIIDLISKRPSGLFPILEEMSILNRKQDNQTLINAYNKAHDRASSCYMKHRVTPYTFVIKHSFADVKYSVDGFLSRNSDSIQQNLANLLLGSSNKFLINILTNTYSPNISPSSSIEESLSSKSPRRLSFNFSPSFGKEDSELTEILMSRERVKMRRSYFRRMSSSGSGLDSGKNNSRRSSQLPAELPIESRLVSTMGPNTQVKAGLNSTVTSQLRGRLNDLINHMKTTEIYFVICVLPNSSQIANTFIKEVVRDQLHSYGIFDVFRLSKKLLSSLHFDTKIEINQFFERYKLLLSSCMDEDEYYELISRHDVSFDEMRSSSMVLLESKLQKSMYHVGLKNIYLHNEFDDLLRRSNLTVASSDDKSLHSSQEHRASHEKEVMSKRRSVGLTGLFKAVFAEIEHNSTKEEKSPKILKGLENDEEINDDILPFPDPMKPYLEDEGKVRVDDSVFSPPITETDYTQYNVEYQPNLRESSLATLLEYANNSSIINYNDLHHIEVVRRFLLRWYRNKRDQSLKSRVEELHLKCQQGYSWWILDELKKHPDDALLAQKTANYGYGFLYHTAIRSNQVDVLKVLNLHPSKVLESSSSGVGNNLIHYAIVHNADLQVVQYLADIVGMVNIDKPMLPTQPYNIKLKAGWLRKQSSDGLWRFKWITLTDTGIQYSVAPRGVDFIDFYPLDREHASFKRSGTKGMYRITISLIGRTSSVKNRTTISLKASAEDELEEWVKYLTVSVRSEGFRDSDPYTVVNLELRTLALSKTNNEGNTCLHLLACGSSKDSAIMDSQVYKNNQLKVGMWLIENGCALGGKNSKGKSALELAMMSDNTELVACIKEQIAFQYAKSKSAEEQAAKHDLHLKHKMGMGHAGSTDVVIIDSNPKSIPHFPYLPTPHRRFGYTYINLFFENHIFQVLDRAESPHELSPPGIFNRKYFPFLTIAVYNSFQELIEPVQNIPCPSILTQESIWWGKYWRMFTPIENLPPACTIVIRFKEIRRQLKGCKVEDIGWAFIRLEKETINCYDLYLDLFEGTFDLSYFSWGIAKTSGMRLQSSMILFRRTERRVSPQNFKGTLEGHYTRTLDATNDLGITVNPLMESVKQGKYRSQSMNYGHINFEDIVEKNDCPPDSPLISGKDDNGKTSRNGSPTRGIPQARPKSLTILSTKSSKSESPTKRKQVLTQLTGNINDDTDDNDADDNEPNDYRKAHIPIFVPETRENVMNKHRSSLTLPSARIASSSGPPSPVIPTNITNISIIASNPPRISKSQINTKSNKDLALNLSMSATIPIPEESESRLASSRGSGSESSSSRMSTARSASSSSIAPRIKSLFAPSPRPARTISLKEPSREMSLQEASRILTTPRQHPLFSSQSRSKRFSFQSSSDRNNNPRVSTDTGSHTEHGADNRESNTSLGSNIDAPLGLPESGSNRSSNETGNFLTPKDLSTSSNSIAPTLELKRSFFGKIFSAVNSPKATDSSVTEKNGERDIRSSSFKSTLTRQFSLTKLTQIATGYPSEQEISTESLKNDIPPEKNLQAVNIPSSSSSSSSLINFTMGFTRSDSKRDLNQKTEKGLASTSGKSVNSAFSNSPSKQELINSRLIQLNQSVNQTVRFVKEKENENRVRSNKTDNNRPKSIKLNTKQLSEVSRSPQTTRKKVATRSGSASSDHISSLSRAMSSTNLSSDGSKPSSINFGDLQPNNFVSIPVEDVDIVSFEAKKALIEGYGEMYSRKSMTEREDSPVVSGASLHSSSKSPVDTPEGGPSRVVRTSALKTSGVSQLSKSTRGKIGSTRTAYVAPVMRPNVFEMSLGMKVLKTVEYIDGVHKPVRMVFTVPTGAQPGTLLTGLGGHRNRSLVIPEGVRPGEKCIVIAVDWTAHIPTP